MNSFTPSRPFSLTQTGPPPGSTSNTNLGNGQQSRLLVHHVHYFANPAVTLVSGGCGTKEDFVNSPFMTPRVAFLCEDNAHRVPGHHVFALPAL